MKAKHDKDGNRPLERVVMAQMEKTMDKQDIEASVYVGEPIDCTAEYYTSFVRKELQRVAAKFVDAGDGMRAQIALLEVRRLDGKFSIAA